jgi:hypothetical protein
VDRDAGRCGLYRSGRDSDLSQGTESQVEVNGRTSDT